MSQSASKSSVQVLIGSLSGKLLNMIALFLVTPILGPEGFGQLLIVGIIVGIFNTVVDIGFEYYYIAKVNLSGPERTNPVEVKLIEDIVFNLRLYSNIILFVAQIIVSYAFVDSWFSSPVDIYLRILAFNYLSGIFGRVNEMRLKKRMEFKSIIRSKILGDFVGSATKVFFVFSGFGIIGWAYGVLIGNFINALALTISGHYKPVIVQMSSKWRKEIFWFAKHSWLSGVGIYLYSQITNIILKSLFPINQVGYVAFSYSYTLEIQSGLLASQSNVLLPYYANYHHDQARVRKGINQYLEASFFVIGFPAIFGAFFGKEILAVVFGDKWTPAYPVFIMYCVYVLIRILFAPSSTILSALGKMKESTTVVYFNFILCSVSLLAVGLTTHNIYWYSLVFVIVSLVSEAIKSIWGLRFIKISIFEIISDCKKNIICLLVLSVVTCLLHFTFSISTFLQMLIAFVACGLLFVGVQFYINRKVFLIFLEKLRMFTRRAVSV